MKYNNQPANERSNHDTRLVWSRNLSPFTLHALPQSEREHLLHPAARLRGALDVLGTDFACDLRALLGRDGPLSLRAKHPFRVVVPAEVRLGCDEYERCTLAKVRYLWVPLVLDVLKTDRKVNGEDDEDDVAFWVAQRPQSIVLLLSCRVPERDLDNLAVELSVCYVVLEHGGYVRFWESIMSVYDQQARLSAAAIPNHDNLSLHVWPLVWP